MYENKIQILRSNYLKAVGYSSTATEFKTCTAKPEIISILKPYICTKGTSVNIHTIPPKPHIDKTVTVWRKIEENIK